MKRREVGVLGEKIACSYLERNGYQIIETNYRCPEGEMDIVARQGGFLVFVEVRTRRSDSAGTPEESITPQKKQKLTAVAEHYGQHHEGLPSARRIDVLAIRLARHGRVSRIELIENAVDGF
jgi:putative endonuclease